MESFEEENLRRKKVDETWKESVDKEKVNQQPSPKKEAQYPEEVTFSLFLSGLMIEGLLALGEMESPVTHKKEIKLEQAKYIIDLVSVLKEKTKNNLTPEEKNGVEQVLYELRMRYVNKVK